ncbi:alpha/beta fold hydrolase [Streptomyces sp. NPDC048295]|uniref:alpha/beta hydrolase n=1 Tax=Streptomyces sp. NPDC048295 TaxID=3154617 RepID=UPI003443857E
MVERMDVEFKADAGVLLRGWLYLPDSPGPHPAITVAHGYAGVKDHGLDPFARKFAENGFVVLLHDHRGFGASEGTPRQDVDPWQQIADWRRAVSYLESRSEVDADRIGLWGTSYAGGHAIVLGATDRRLRAVVSQVPTISGYEQGLRRIAPEAVAALEEAFNEDERAQARGEAPRSQTIVSADPTVAASYRTQEAIDFYLQPVPDGVWENQVTVRSTRAARMYEPGTWITRVSPTPLLMVVALSDTVTVTDLALGAYERALEPKRLQLIRGGHFAPYISEFEQSSSAAVAWFQEHLTDSVRS